MNQKTSTTALCKGRSEVKGIDGGDEFLIDEFEECLEMAEEPCRYPAWFSAEKMEKLLDTSLMKAFEIGEDELDTYRSIANRRLEELTSEEHGPNEYIGEVDV